MVTLTARTVERQRMLTVFMGRRIRHKRSPIWGRVERKALSRPISPETSQERVRVRELPQKRGLIVWKGKGGGFERLLGTNRKKCQIIHEESVQVQASSFRVLNTTGTTTKILYFSFVLSNNITFIIFQI